MTKNIYIYSDDGVGEFSLYCTKNFFSKENVTCVTANKIIKEGIPNTIDLFIIPGGADRFYAQKLNGQGNRNIKTYVEDGGTYLGICAGAYYGCQRFEFQKGTNNEICTNRELGFFQGTAIGCLPEIAPVYDKTINSAVVTPLQIKEGKTNCVYWGGCCFTPDANSTYNVIASYDGVAGQPPAIISCPVKKGRAILSGVHFDMEQSDVEIFYEDSSAKQKLINGFKKSDTPSLSDIIKESHYDYIYL